ncbi:hypothetical protein [Limnochorda pilosa]|uniref:Uncharacterized protein n=1 Tax=Limnochorda pilosa TaxID=1555112 RepID=A0A0K2SFV4_LIMPI|nr:hypothetical protein [Limnochorda pilosa]BAS25917.1 hypothetical protein LIP_0060 [Limnochorda pilosa]
MDFEAAANLVAALRPFVHPTKHPDLEGFERLVRTASRLTGELTEVRTMLPASPVRRLRRNPADAGDTPVQPEPGQASGEGEGGDAGLGAVSVAEPESERARSTGGLGRPGSGLGGKLGSPLTLLLLLILLIEVR